MPDLRSFLKIIELGREYRLDVFRLTSDNLTRTIRNVTHDTRAQNDIPSSQIKSVE